MQPASRSANSRHTLNVYPRSPAIIKGKKLQDCFQQCKVMEEIIILGLKQIEEITCILAILLYYQPWYIQTSFSIETPTTFCKNSGSWKLLSNSRPGCFHWCLLTKKTCAFFLQGSADGYLAATEECFRERTSCRTNQASVAY